MCLSTALLAMFLSYLPQDILEVEEDQVQVHATAGTVVWKRTGETWCYGENYEL